MRKEPRDYLKIQEDPNEEAGIRSTFCLQSRILSWRWSGRAFLILHVVVVLGKAAPSMYLSISCAADLWDALRPTLRTPPGKVGERVLRLSSSGTSSQPIANSMEEVV